MPDPAHNPETSGTGHSNYSSGEYRVSISTLHDSPELRSWLQNLPNTVTLPETQLIYRLRNKVHSVECPPLAADIGRVCVKEFARPSLMRSLSYQRIGSKAQRSFVYALHMQRHGVGVPEPIAFVERWNGVRLVESYFLSAFEEGISDFNSEMVWVLRKNPDCHQFLALLRTVAEAIRKMHDSGFMHNDLGGQNITLRRRGLPSHDLRWDDVGFIDLNRGRLYPALTLRQRGRDLAKLEIPSHLRRIFFHNYFRDEAIPQTFSRWESFYRARITFHNESRKYRHPIRHLVHSKRYIVPSSKLPGYQDMWLWDEKSGQPSVLLESKDRRRFRSKLDAIPLLWRNLSLLPQLRKHYLKLKHAAYTQPVAMKNRIGVSLEVLDDRWEQRRKLLEGLEGIPVMVRCYHHKGSEGLDRCEKAVRELHAAGHEVSLAIVQSRASVLNSEDWAAFVSDVLQRMHTCVRFVEIGHAVNRVKWGIWSYSEAEKLWSNQPDWSQIYPHLTILGPAVNDFEYYAYPPLLKNLSRKIGGLSCHLYVDRRGAPENFQGKFSLLEKCILGRAMAEAHGINGFFVTETNWPLLGTGIYSPISCPYLFPGKPESNLHVDELTYAAYLVRYYLIALCSGMCERVWWWRLASHGFGLADDLDNFRRRPAWYALAFLHKTLGNSTFLRYEEQGGCIRFHFNNAIVSYAPHSPIQAPHNQAALYSMTGEELENGAMIGTNPVYQMS